MHTDPDFANRLLTWFDQFGRKDLPWQIDKTPYRVWVSEIMLQQTQVTTVIPYYERFMQSFPNVLDLAHAHEDEVLEHWAGLGYYARARNLHKAAKQVANEFDGEFPTSVEGLVELSGIGRSTAGAIYSIAMNGRAPILDGNVKRVLARHEAIDSWPGLKPIETAMWEIAEQYTPLERVDDYTQAIMDLGATLCTRSKPDCQRCPMQASCKAFVLSKQTELPASKPKKSIPTKATLLLHVQDEAGNILMEKRPPTGIWGGLYSLPQADKGLSKQELTNFCHAQFGLKCKIESYPQPFKHTFSHYHLEIYPVLLTALKQTESHGVKEGASLEWHTQSAIGQLGLPAPIKKYLSQTQNLELALD